MRGTVEASTLQNAAGAMANGAVMQASGMSVAAFQVSGTFVGTVTFEATLDGTNWVVLPTINVATGAQALTATAPGLFAANVQGVNQVRARVSAYVSGAITVSGVVADNSFAPAGAATAAVSATQLPAALGQTTMANSLAVVIASDQSRVPVVEGSAPGAPASYRAAVVAADVMAAPGAVTTSLVNGVGALSAGTYNIKVVAINAYGRTTPTAGSGTVVTTGANLAARAAFAAVAGAVAYDIYCSTDADPKFTGRITETQRASGIIINGHNTTTAGSIAGAVDIYAIGTGLQAATTAAQNTAYTIPASPVNCAGYQYCDFDLTVTRAGDDVLPALVVIPFFQNSRTSTYHAGTVQTVTFGGASAAYGPLKQRLRVEARGSAGLALVVASISGTGVSLDVDASLV